MRHLGSIFLALTLILSHGMCAHASGEPSGGNTRETTAGETTPADFENLPTIEAQPLMEVTADRVGLEAPV